MDLHKYIFSLGPQTRITMFFEGEGPGRQAFKMLRSYIDLIEMTMIPEEVKRSELPVAVRIPKRKKIFTLKPPCQVHPDSPRHPNTNRCIACEKDHIRNMVERRYRQA